MNIDDDNIFLTGPFVEFLEMASTRMMSKRAKDLQQNRTYLKHLFINLTREKNPKVPLEIPIAILEMTADQLPGQLLLPYPYGCSSLFTLE